jgi:hypothetical protein
LVREQIQRGAIIAIAVDSSAARNGLLTDHQITEVSGHISAVNIIR